MGGSRLATLKRSHDLIGNEKRFYHRTGRMRQVRRICILPQQPLIFKEEALPMVLQGFLAPKRTFSTTTVNYPLILHF